MEPCSPGPECDYGAAYEAFEAWGNAVPQGIDDCTFAAAADWEQIVLGWHAYPSAIRQEFAAAGGSAGSGLLQAALFSYWDREGIAGSYLTGLHALTASAAEVRRAVRARHALIAQLDFPPGARLGAYAAETGLHDAVVMGFTRRGLLIVSWGTALQVSWSAWARLTVGLWSVVATNPAS